MTYNLVFLKFNNYYNRKIKRYETLGEYLNKYDYYIDDSVTVIDYNDGINVKITFNKNEEKNSIGYNYIIAINAETENTIESRWFILEESQTRQGQWILSLRRDLIADFYDKFISSTIYIEKGRITQDITTIQNINPLIFNQEDFSANQIKKKETPIKDTLGCKWIVGYLNKGYNKKGDSVSEEEDKVIVSHTNLGTVPDTSVATESELAFLNKYKNNTVSYPTSLTASFNYYAREAQKLFKINVSENTNSYSNLSGGRYSISGSLEPNYNGGFADKFLDRHNYSGMLTYAITKFKNAWATDKSEWFRVLGLNNKTILVKDVNKTYRCVVKKHTLTDYSTGVSSTNDPVWYDNLIAYINRVNGIRYTDGDDLFTINLTRSEGLSIELIDIENENYSCIVPVTRNRTLQESFDAFAIPYVDDKAIAFHLAGVAKGEITGYKGAIAVAQEICDTAVDTIDLQLLPYCPLPEDLIAPTYLGPDWTEPYKSQYMITVDEDMVNILASPIRDSSNAVKNVIFWLNSTEFSSIISYEDTNDYSTPDKVKAINQLDTWRLESGDYSSSFEFNMARNGGVQYFEIDCHYKPYQPYIHVAPNFGGLYGSDYNDTRGLVCSNTNYSLPRLTDTWENYERNNLNYMNSFNRQIQNMEVQRKYQRGSEIASLVAGAGSGAAGGAIAGSMIAPGIGTAVGAVVGTVASVGAGIADVAISEQLYKENKQYAIDQFNMSLQNIRALPNTLVAAGALNPNNKVFPILSYYTCSDVERDAFEQKLRWNGYTIGVITETPELYIDIANDTYLKGQLIYIDIPDAAHEASELANELAKGVIFIREGE